MLRNTTGLWHTLAPKSLVESRRRRSARDVDSKAAALVSSLWHVCVGQDAEQSVVGQWMQAHMSQHLITHGCALQSMPSCHKGAAPTEGMHLWEGAIEVVGTPVVCHLKAAEVGVLGKRQRGEQAHQPVGVQLPAAGMRGGGQGQCRG
jgi:hypothetical protein